MHPPEDRHLALPQTETRRGRSQLPVRVRPLQRLSPLTTETTYRPFQPPTDPRTLRLIPVGGCGEFGMNMTAVLHGGRLFVVDCGLRFPDATKLGVDAAVPDVDPWFDQAGGVQAYLITHGHEDHIGALPYIVPKWPAPIYATAWTAELIKNKFLKHGVDLERHPVTVVASGDKIQSDGFSAEYIHITHSIPDCCSLMIRTSAGNVFHTGDFKIDPAPLIEAPTDWPRIEAAGSDGVDLMLTDSTNAHLPGICPGEASVLKPLVDSLREATGAVVVTTFSSNLWRLKTIADACAETGRRLFIAGAGIETTIEVARRTGMWTMPPGLRIGVDEVGAHPREKTCVLASGCQGEWRSAMARIAGGEYKNFALAKGDTVVLSARVIPGNERSVLSMIDQLIMIGAKVVSARDRPGIHVSGHAYRGELEQLLRALKPKWHVPVHGTFSHLKAAATAPGGPDPESRVGVANGDVIELTPKGVAHLAPIEIEVRWVDGDSSALMPHDVLRERLRIGELGMAIVDGVYSLSGRKWLVDAAIEYHGLPLPRWMDVPMWTSDCEDEIASLVETRTARVGGAQPTHTVDEVIEDVRILLRRKLAAVLKKKPVVLVRLHLLP